ncbi:MAG TPA: RNA methyltransferase [bacterium]|nr:RNA methyltransferase [bacterium]
MRLTSTKNPLVRRLRALADRPAREREGRLVIEGVRLVEDVLDARVPLELLLYDPAASKRDARLGALVARAAAAGVRLIEAAPHVIAAASQVDTPQGVLAVVEIPRPAPAPLLDHPDLLLVVADRIHDPGNLGTLIRVADAAGATGVAATRGTVDPYNPKAVRASMGSVFHLPVVMVERNALLQELDARGIRILVADPRGAVDYTAAPYTPPLAIVLGGEAEGAHPAWREAAVAAVRIPLYGRAESLNVASAAALLLYEARRRREG